MMERILLRFLPYLTLTFYVFYSTGGWAEVVQSFELPNAEQILQPSQYGRGGDNVKDMFAREFKKWVNLPDTKSQLKTVDGDGKIVMANVVQNLCTSDKNSFCSYLSKTVSPVPVFAYKDTKTNSEKYLQTDGHHRTSAFVGEFNAILKKDDQVEITKDLVGFLKMVGVKEDKIDDEPPPSNSEFNANRKFLKVNVKIMNKSAQEDDSPSLVSTIKDMIKANKILPSPDRMEEWKGILQKINAGDYDSTPDKLNDALWGGVKPLIPTTFPDLKDSPHRSFMGNFMFFANLDSDFLKDYIEFSQDRNGPLFGKVLFEKCKGVEIPGTPYSKKPGIPEPDEGNAMNKDFQKAVMHCLFNTEKGLEALEWLKTSGYRNEDLKEKAQLMADLARIQWLVDNYPEDAGELQDKYAMSVCEVVKKNKKHFKIEHSKLSATDLYDCKGMTSMIKHLIGPLKADRDQAADEAVNQGLICGLDWAFPKKHSFDAIMRLTQNGVLAADGIKDRDESKRAEKRKELAELFMKKTENGMKGGGMRCRVTNDGTIEFMGHGSQWMPLAQASDTYGELNYHPAKREYIKSFWPQLQELNQRRTQFNFDEYKDYISTK